MTETVVTQTPAFNANAIDARVFPPSSRRGSQCEQLKIGEIRATELTERFGSPLYVVDEQAARSKARAVREALQREAERVGTEATVYYATKAFLCVEVAKWMIEEGLALDVASGGELLVALAAGADPAKIGFHGNNKSVAEIARAVEVGVGTIILDSEIEIERVAAAAKAAGKVQRVRLRVNSGVHASTHDFLATSHEDQKFGQPLAAATRIVGQILTHDSLDFVGLHCHIGSQIFATDGFLSSLVVRFLNSASVAALVSHTRAKTQTLRPMLRRSQPSSQTSSPLAPRSTVSRFPSSLSSPVDRSSARQA